MVSARLMTGWEGKWTTHHCKEAAAEQLIEADLRASRVGATAFAITPVKAVLEQLSEI
jgi:hypothetical protein